MLGAGAYLIAINPRELSPDETTLLSTIVGAVVGAVATYLGVNRADSGGDTHHHYPEEITVSELPTNEPVEPEPTVEPDPDEDAPLEDPGPPEDAPPESTDEELRAMYETDTPKEE
jgi:hypothetical protein